MKTYTEKYYNRPSVWVNHTGKFFGKLFVKECLILSNGKNKQGLYRCKCDCGKYIEISGMMLVRKNSCGCLQKETRKKKHIENSLKKRSFSQLTINSSYYSHSHSAKLKGKIPLSKEEWLKIVVMPCHYCGEIDIKNKTTNKTYRSNFGVTLTPEIEKLYEAKINGIDRLDNTIGYVLNNCVPCCRQCNTMKMDYPVDIFLHKVDTIYNKQISIINYDDVYNYITL